MHGLGTSTGGASLVLSLHSIFTSPAWLCMLEMLCAAAPMLCTRAPYKGCPAKLKHEVLGSCAGEVPAMPARDHRRTAKKLADAGRWADSVQMAQERGTFLDDALLLRAIDGLADQVTI